MSDTEVSRAAHRCGPRLRVMLGSSYAGPSPPAGPLTIEEPGRIPGPVGRRWLVTLAWAVGHPGRHITNQVIQSLDLGPNWADPEASGDHSASPEQRKIDPQVHFPSWRLDSSAVNRS